MVIGVIKFGWFAAPAGTLLLCAAAILLLTMAEAAILTLLCLLVTNRAVSGVAAILLANQELTHPVVSLCASVGITLLVSAIGMAVFKRKDLK